MQHGQQTRWSKDEPQRGDIGIQLRERLGPRAADPYKWLSGEMGLKWVYKMNLDLDRKEGCFRQRESPQAEGKG